MPSPAPIGPCARASKIDSPGSQFRLSSMTLFNFVPLRWWDCGNDYLVLIFVMRLRSGTVWFHPPGPSTPFAGTGMAVYRSEAYFHQDCNYHTSAVEESEFNPEQRYSNSFTPVLGEESAVSGLPTFHLAAAVS